MTLHYEGDDVSGCLKLVGYQNRVQGAREKDGSLHLVHVIQTAVSTFRCETSLQCRDGRLRGSTTAKPCRISWEGTLLSHKE